MRIIPILLIIGLIFLNLPLVFGNTSDAEIRVSQNNEKPSMKEFLIVVSRGGFNGSRDLQLTVEQGDTVKIKFVYGDTDLQTDNPHRIEIPEYGISVRLSREEPSEEVTLVTNQPGSFKIRCTLRCRGHENLQDGVLVVRPTSKKLTNVKISPWLSSTPSGYLVGAMVLTENDEPVKGIIIRFLVETSFGPVVIGSAVTNHAGNASLLYKPPSAGKYVVHIVFDGGGGLSAANATAVLTSTMAFPPLELPQVNIVSQNYWPDPRLIGVPIEANTVLIVLVSSVVMTAWGVILFTVRSLLQIRRISEDRERAT
jgi:hypothetical protein